MPASPEFSSVVPSGWNLQTLITLLQINADNVIMSEDSSGELILAVGYKERDDGCLVKVR
jgi:hypothetical protein